MALIIFVIAIVALMAFTAMAVDLGNIGQTKEHTETAVQDAALSAVSDLAFGASGFNASTQEAAAVTDAENYLIANYGSVTLASFNSPGCPGALPSGVTAWAGPSPAATNCIGFWNPNGGSNETAIAVAIPGQTVNYTFGHAAGLNHQNVSSIAFAILQPPAGTGGLPFAYSSGGGNGLNCLKSGSGNKSGPCGGFTTGSGQFGIINSPRYTIFPGNSTAGGNNAVIATDIVLGIDHGLNVWPTPNEGNKFICDQANNAGGCTYYNGQSSGWYNTANQVEPQTGQTLNDPTPSLFLGGVTTPDGSCTLNPLLNHPDGFTVSGSCSADNPTTGPTGVTLLSASGDTFGSSYALNGVQISAFLNPATRSSPAMTACNADLTTSYDAYSGSTAQVTGYDLASGDLSPSPPAEPIDYGGTGSSNVWFGSNTSSYDDCLSNIMASSSGPLFTSAIEKSPRFGQVPVVSSSNGGGSETIVGFIDVYLDVAFGKNNKIDSLFAWVFPNTMIDDTPAYQTGGTNYTGGSFLTFLCSYGTTC